MWEGGGDGGFVGCRKAVETAVDLRDMRHNGDDGVFKSDERQHRLENGEEMINYSLIYSIFCWLVFHAIVGH